MQLRAQFEKQLLSSAVPQIYEPKDSFLLKRTDQLADDEHLARKMEMTAQKPTNQKAQNESKAQIKDIRNVITNEELQIYEKQKIKVNEMREQPITKIPTKLDDNE